MPRTYVAFIGGIVFVLAYIVAVVTLPDYLPPQHWAVQAVYWLVAGTVWVFPIWGLMLWSKR